MGDPRLGKAPRAHGGRAGEEFRGLVPSVCFEEEGRGGGVGRADFRGVEILCRGFCGI